MGHDRLDDDRGIRSASSREHLAKLEALFAPKSAPKTPAASHVATASKRDSATMVSVTRAPIDARAAEVEPLVARLLAAAGRTDVSRAADEIARAGFAFPNEQEVQLQLLEHADEAGVRCAMQSLARLLDVEPPKRRTVLESRLRRIEEHAEESATRDLASVLRRKLGRAPRPL